MLSPLMRRAGLALLTLVAAGCSQPTPAAGPSFAAQDRDQVYFGPPAIPGVDGPLATTQPDVPGEPWAMGPPIVVTTAELMARGSGVARDRSTSPRLIKIRPDRNLALDNPFAPPVAQWPPSPRFREGGPAAAFVAGTPNVNIGLLVDTGGATPPDTMGDVGPTQYVLAMNGRVRAVSKATGLVDPVFDLDSDVFYGAAANGQPTGDPRVRYDRRAGRWYILMFNIAVPNRYLLAVSSSSTITAGTTWTIHFWNNTRTQGGVGGGAGCLGDYPTLGVDEDALYIGVNQFCGASLNMVTFDSTSVYVLNRANLLLGGAPTVVQFDAVLPNGSVAGVVTPQGVDNFDNNTNEGYIIGVDNATFGTLMLRRVINPGSLTPSLSADVPLTVPTTTFPIPVPQPGPAPSLDALDDRLLHAVVRNGRLWTLHQIQVNASGVGSNSGGRTGQRWYEIGNLSGALNLVQSGTVFDSAVTNPTHHWMGAIMVNGQGHAALGMSRGGAATFVNTEFTGRLAGAALGTMEAPTQYSSNTATVMNIQSGASRQRWGDYSYTSVDPNDDMTMWTLQEYPNASNSYAVRLIRLLAPPPAAIASLSPNSVAAGQTGVSVTVTGTSTAGSGFFDPGAGFASRIAAAFSGTGVTVTNIAFTSPTSLTLTLSTVGAAAGARTLTVTNPDAQQASFTSALTITAAGGSAPTTVADAFNTPFNTALTVTAPGVLSNDNTNGGGPVTAELVSSTSSGALTLNANGSVTYTPNIGFSGGDSFTYRAVNTVGPGSTVTVSIAVGAAVPTTVADAYNTPYQTVLNVTAPGVLGNDVTNGGGAMTAQLVSTATRGALTLAANGGFAYTPNAGVSGGDSFTYRATNGVGPSTTVTVTISVGAPPTPPPTSNNDSYSGTDGTPLAIAAAGGVLANDTSNGGGVMTAAVVANPANGMLTLGSDGAFVYTPTTGFIGTDTFTYRATNLGGPGNVATVSIAVAAITTPQPPSNFRIIGRSGAAVTFAWTLPTRGPAPASLQLEGGFTPGSVVGALPLGVTPSFTVTLPTGSFYIRLRTLAAGQTSAASNEVLTHVNVPVVPSAPANLLGLTNGTALGLAWTPTFAGGASSGVTLEVSGALSASLPLGAVDNFSFPSVPPGTYTFTVRQTGTGGTSPASPPVTLTFPGGCSGAPQVPANFFAFNAAGILSLSWDPPLTGAAPTGYLLNVTGSFVGTLPMNTRTFNTPGPAGTFNLAVVATNPCGASAPTATRTVSFP